MGTVANWLGNVLDIKLFWVGARDQGGDDIKWLTSDNNVELPLWHPAQPDPNHGDCVFLAPPGALAMGDCGNTTHMHPLCQI